MLFHLMSVTIANIVQGGRNRSRNSVAYLPLGGTVPPMGSILSTLLWPGAWHVAGSNVKLNAASSLFCRFTVSTAS